eukprot:CAMPEP_0184706966 /NCGR_PEP_ID=MMETSP0313-20130426/37030_1 /TAXON_ID=2792 /ORGANISM="Porphyridium aerugineum, Strain SAG 1380-2" /LENGTH=765 /DNA_ID=CAMNT_0027168535 /DNA_START=62 /DNA_END=2360 /DNA_ORIENTATION=-
MECGDPSFSVSAILHRTFKNDQVASWLLSRDPSPPSLNQHMLKAALTGDMRTMTHNAAKALLEESIGTDWSESSSSVDGAYPQPTLFFGHLGNRKEGAENENAHQEGPKLRPLMKPGNEDGGASLETMTSVCHSINGNYAFITAADSRTPFAFLEPAGEVVPGVRRSIVETSDKDVFGASCFRKADGRLSMVFFVYPYDLSKPARKCFVLLKPHPPSRYPTESDILEIGWNASKYQCQFCLLRGWDQCECPPSVKQRTWPKLPAVDQRDPWSMCFWFYGVFEAGFKKQKFDLYNVSRNIGVSAQIVYHVNPSCLNKDRRRHEYGYQRYLHAIQPVYTRIMLNCRMDGSSAKPLMSNVQLLDGTLENPRNPTHEDFVVESDNTYHDQESARIVEDILEQQEQRFTEKEALRELRHPQSPVQGRFAQGEAPLYERYKRPFENKTPYLSDIRETELGQGLNTPISIYGTELAEPQNNDINEKLGPASSRDNVSRAPAAKKRLRGSTQEKGPIPEKKSRTTGDAGGSSDQPNNPSNLDNSGSSHGDEKREADAKQAAQMFLREIDEPQNNDINEKLGPASSRDNVSRAPAAKKRLRSSTQEKGPIFEKKSRTTGDPGGSSDQPNNLSNLHNNLQNSGSSHDDEKQEADAKQEAQLFLREIDRMEIHHNAPCSCKICGKDFSRKYDLKRHVMTGHLDIREFICPICGHKAKRKQHLDIHHQLVHDKESIQASCELCGKVLVSGFSLKRHKRLVHKIDDIKDENVLQGEPS